MDERFGEAQKTTATLPSGQTLMQNEVGPLRNLDEAVNGHILITQVREAWLKRAEALEAD